MLVTKGSICSYRKAGRDHRNKSRFASSSLHFKFRTSSSPALTDQRFVHPVIMFVRMYKNSNLTLFIQSTSLLTQKRPDSHVTRSVVS